MRKLVLIASCCAVLLSLSVSAFADEYDDTSNDNGTSTVVYSDVASNPNYTLTDVQLLRSVSPVTPSDTSGLKSAMLGVLGDYDPIIVEYQYTSTQGYVSYLREVQIDYVWIASACMLALVIFCLFRLGGALIG